MKLVLGFGAAEGCRAPPARGRGLKLYLDVAQQPERGSPPARGRGLKLLLHQLQPGPGGGFRLLRRAAPLKRHRRGAGQRLRRRFLSVWRLLADRLGEELAWLRHLPADTRIPDHTIWNHLDMTAGLHAALSGQGGAAFLSFSLGPVQPFIAAARPEASPPGPGGWASCPYQQEWPVTRRRKRLDGRLIPWYAL